MREDYVVEDTLLLYWKRYFYISKGIGIQEQQKE